MVFDLISWEKVGMVLSLWGSYALGCNFRTRYSNSFGYKRQVFDVRVRVSALTDSRVILAGVGFGHALPFNLNASAISFALSIRGSVMPILTKW